MKLIFQPCTIVFVCGPVRSGKTYLINEWCKRENRLVRFDATGETVEDETMLHIWNSPKQLNDAIKVNPYAYRIAYHPGTDILVDFEWASKILWRTDASKVLVCDEFHEIAPVNDTPRWIQTILRYARHDRMGLIAASQRIADVHKLFTQSANMVILFHTTEARDLDAIESRWRCADLVENLRPLLYEDLTGKTKQIPQCVVIQKGTKPRIYDFKTDSFMTINTLVPSKEAAMELDTEAIAENERENSYNTDTEEIDSSPDATGDSTNGES